MNEKVPSELVWADGGEHLHEIALAALSDGQARSLPEGAVKHAAGCEQCCSRIAEFAELSVLVSAHVVRLRENMQTQVASKKLPAGELFAGLLFAILGAIPSLEGAPLRIRQLGASLFKLGPRTAIGLVRALSGYVDKHQTEFSLMCVFLTLLIIGSGFLIARRTPRRFVQGVLS